MNKLGGIVDGSAGGLASCGRSGRELRPGRSEDASPDLQITPTPLRPSSARRGRPWFPVPPAGQLSPRDSSQRAASQNDHRRVRAGRRPKAGKYGWDLGPCATEAVTDASISKTPRNLANRTLRCDTDRTHARTPKLRPPIDCARRALPGTSQENRPYF